MARFYFTRNFDYCPLAPSRKVVMAYRAGQTYTVKRECADLAVISGAGRELPAPRRRRRVPDGE